MGVVILDDIRNGILAAGASDQPVCIHASLSSFGRVEGGADAVVDAFLREGCTLMVPTFSYRFLVGAPPEDRPARNGMRYEHEERHRSDLIFTPDSNELSQRDMGAVPAAVLARPQRVRGNHPTSSFAAVGPLAERIMSTQAPVRVFAPLEELAALRGRVILMGVGLTRMTLLHVAENHAGRRYFRRWALGPDGQVMTCQVGSCSEGFETFAPVLTPIERRLNVGPSPWRAFPAADVLRLCTEAVRATPGITHCDNPRCVRCEDAMAGGPDA